MTQTLGLRVASLGASALLLAAAVIAALNVTYTISDRGSSEGGVIDIVPFVEPDRPPPPPVEPHNTVRPLNDDAYVVATLPAPETPIEQIATIEQPFVQTAAAPEIVNAEWRRRPRDLSRYYPASALRRGVEGEVVLECSVSLQGRLGCVVASETPQGWGFSDAALRISRDHVMVPATRGGVPVEARYRMRVPFSVQ